MIIAAADVKPTDTGPDIKSNKNPNIERVKNNLTSHILYKNISYINDNI